MELTGKCKDAFEKWFDINNYDRVNLTHKFVYKLTESMKYGIYVDFFDSVGIYIDIDSGVKRDNDSGLVINVEHWGEIMNEMGSYHSETSPYKTRSEARTEAIKLSNNWYNETNQPSKENH